MPHMSRESQGVGVFSFLMNDRRASSETDAFSVCFTTIRDGVERLSVTAFQFILLLSVHFWLYTLKKFLFLTLPPLLPSPSQSPLSIPAKPLPVPKNCITFWAYGRPAPPHWHQGVHRPLLYWLKVLVW